MEMLNICTLALVAILLVLIFDFSYGISFRRNKRDLINFMRDDIDSELLSILSFMAVNECDDVTIEYVRGSFAGVINTYYQLDLLEVDEYLRLLDVADCIDYDILDMAEVKWGN